MNARLPTSLALLGALFLALSCGDAGPESGPGTVTAVVVSPNGDEGAAVITLDGAGIGTISDGAAQVYSRSDGNLVTVVVINEPGGELSFRVALADTTVKPAATIQQVASPSDDLRATLAGYEVEYVR